MSNIHQTVKFSARYFAPAVLALACLFLAGCATPVKDTSRTFHTVVIDPGHGGKDSGAYSRKGGAEKMAALDVAQQVDKELRHAGFQTVMTRDSDVFIPLNERAAISNRQDNAIFVSIHFNDSRNHRIRGTEAYYNSGPAREIAERIQACLAPVSQTRGVMHANFRVLRLNEYPAVLVECGYLSNPREAALCANTSYREKLASGIAAGILQQRYGSSGVPPGQVASSAASSGITPHTPGAPESFSN